MQFLFDSCNANGGTCLLSAKDIANNVYSKIDLSEYEVDEVVKNLIFDNYIDVVYSDKKGQTIYCIKLTEQGQAFARERHNTKVKASVLIIRTVLLAILSFVVGIILKAIFS